VSVAAAGQLTAVGQAARGVGMGVVGTRRAKSSASKAQQATAAQAVRKPSERADM